MRLRFAPSPTGPLHIGGVRTALYNYLLAKKHGGTFILRIEDTDQTRYVPGAEDYIIESLRWCGIMPTEGSGIGGEHGPYRQSERKDRYEQYALQLVESGHAYFAFDTEDELKALQERAMASNETRLIRTEGKNSFTLSAEEVEAHKASGENVVIRFLAPSDETIIINDLIKGEVRFDSNTLDDKVLLKTDGMPTYHMANIVDDHQMEITHVIRGEEWLPSTALHSLLYRYLGWEQPQFAHLPLILKPAPNAFLNKKNIEHFADKFTHEFLKKTDLDTDEGKVRHQMTNLLRDYKNLSAVLKIRDKDSNLQKEVKGFLKDSLFGKLSKRDGARLGFPVFPMEWEGNSPEESFAGFKETGFESWAMLNFLAFLGWNPGTEQEMFSVDELVDAFSVERIGKSGARFDFEKAKWFNQQYLKSMDDAAIAARLQPTLEAQGITADLDFLSHFANLLKERVHYFNDFLEKGYYFFESVKNYDERTIQKRWKTENKGHFDDLYQLLENLNPFEASELETAIKGFIEEKGLSFSEVFPILRIACSGTTQGPDLFRMMALLGKTEVLSRLSTAFVAFDEVVAKAV